MTTRKLFALILAGLLGLAPVVSAQTWDPAKPPTGPASPLVSADIRSNWHALAEAIGGVNLLADPTFLIWHAGDAAVPAHWSMSGAGAAVARETGTVKVGTNSVKLTSGAGNLAFQQQLLPAAAFTASASYLQGEPVACGVWLWTASAGNAVGAHIYDGVSYTGTSHTGSSTWEWITVTRTLDAAATELTFRISVLAAGTIAYVSGPTCVLGPVAPEAFKPAPMDYETVDFFFPGNVSASTDQRRWHPHRPMILDFVQIWVLTAPATTAIIVDVNTWDGAALTSMFSTRPQINAAGIQGGAAPDSTYARRCMTGHFATATAVGNILSIDIDQVGTGTTGANLTVQLRAKYYQRPLAAFLGYADVY